jgi:hypothetical protein
MPESSLEVGAIVIGRYPDNEIEALTHLKLCELEASMNSNWSSLAARQWRQYVHACTVSAHECKPAVLQHCYEL